MKKAKKAMLLMENLVKVRGSTLQALESMSDIDLDQVMAALRWIEDRANQSGLDWTENRLT